MVQVHDASLTSRHIMETTSYTTTRSSTPQTTNSALHSPSTNITTMDQLKNPPQKPFIH